MIAFIILLAVAGIGCFLITIEAFRDNVFSGLFSLFFGLGCIFLSYAGVLSNIKESTYVKALINNPYKMEVRYELKDSVYIPIDTVYILK